MWFSLMLLLGGCLIEREPGPHLDDEEKYTYWAILDSFGSTTGCTDSQSWEALIVPPQFDPYNFIIYRVEEGGETAMGQDCARLSPSTCSDNEQVYVIDRHTLISEMPEQTVLQQGGCAIVLKSRWEIADNGPTGIFTLPASFEYVGGEDSCSVLEEQIKSESPNGLGLENCTTGVVVNLLLDRIVAKAE